MTDLRIRLYACRNEECLRSGSCHPECIGYELEHVSPTMHYHVAPLAEALDWYIRKAENA